MIINRFNEKTAELAVSTDKTFSFKFYFAIAIGAGVVLTVIVSVIVYLVRKNVKNKEQRLEEAIRRRRRILVRGVDLHSPRSRLYHQLYKSRGISVSTITGLVEHRQPPLPSPLTRSVSEQRMKHPITQLSERARASTHHSIDLL